MTIEAYEILRRKGYLLAGGLSDLSQRACVYHHMYEDSGKRNVFPLIAAHGALWASGYFKKGMISGRILSMQYMTSPTLLRARLESLSDFADKFRDINRRVCAESFAIYHYTKRFENSGCITSIIGEEFSKSLHACHKASDLGVDFSREDRQILFCEFFRWEQENIVAPSVSEAYEQFHWGAVKYLALRPKIQFAYFGNEYTLRFENFSSKSERMEKGLSAYRRAESVGWARVESSMRNYNLMPGNFFRDPKAYYQGVERECRLPADYDAKNRFLVLPTRATVESLDA